MLLALTNHPVENLSRVIVLLISIGIYKLLVPMSIRILQVGALLLE